MGARGPAPKRDSERRRRNAKAKPTTKAAGKPPAPPKAHAKWHPIAKRWYNSLSGSGQSEFYQESDWALAYLIGEDISRHLRPQTVITPSGAIQIEQPMSGATLAALLKGMSALMVTEGDRRRLGIELTNPKPQQGGAAQDVPSLDDARRRKRSS